MRRSAVSHCAIVRLASANARVNDFLVPQRPIEESVPEVGPLPAVFAAKGTAISSGGGDHERAGVRAEPPSVQCDPSNLFPVPFPGIVGEKPGSPDVNELGGVKKIWSRHLTLKRRLQHDPPPGVRRMKAKRGHGSFKKRLTRPLAKKRCEPDLVPKNACHQAGGLRSTMQAPPAARSRAHSASAAMRVFSGTRMMYLVAPRRPRGEARRTSGSRSRKTVTAPQPLVAGKPLPLGPIGGELHTPRVPRRPRSDSRTRAQTGGQHLGGLSTANPRLGQDLSAPVTC